MYIYSLNIYIMYWEKEFDNKKNKVIKKKKPIVAKALDGKQYPCPTTVLMIKGVYDSMIYVFTHMRNFLLLVILYEAGWGGEENKMEGGEGENFPYVPLQGGCPKRDMMNKKKKIN